MSKSMLGTIALRPADALAQDGTEYTASIQFDACAGDATALVVSTAGSITIDQQCSLDDETWYDPTIPAGTATGNVTTALGVTTGAYIVFTVVLAPYVRFKITENDSAATVVTFTLIYRHER